MGLTLFKTIVLNIIMLMIYVSDKTPHTHEHSHTAPHEHVYLHMIQYLREMRAGNKESLCDNLSMNQVRVELHLSQRRSSAALPPTGLWGEGLTADGWADLVHRMGFYMRAENIGQ